jgi:DNA-binding transcriptional regulator PaaX
MRIRPFHHPDFSLPVLRRQAGEVLLDLLLEFTRLVATQGRSLTWDSSYPNRNAYYNAVYRLRKAGLVAYRRHGGREPVLVLTDSDNLNRLKTGRLKPQMLAALAREEMAAYLSVMQDDPLLPMDLWPTGYRGKNVWNLHQRMVRAVANHE